MNKRVPTEKTDPECHDTSDYFTVAQLNCNKNFSFSETINFLFTKDKRIQQEKCCAVEWFLEGF